MGNNVSKEELLKKIEEYTKAIEQNPKDDKAYLSRGAVYGKLGKYDLAIADCNKVLELNPHNEGAKLYRKKAYKELRNNG